VRFLLFFYFNVFDDLCGTMASLSEIAARSYTFHLMHTTRGNIWFKKNWSTQLDFRLRRSYTIHVTILTERRSELGLQHSIRHAMHMHHVIKIAVQLITCNDRKCAGMWNVTQSMILVPRQMPYKYNAYAILTIHNLALNARISYTTRYMPYPWKVNTWTTVINNSVKYRISLYNNSHNSSGEFRLLNFNECKKLQFTHIVNGDGSKTAKVTEWVEWVGFNVPLNTL